MASAKDIEDFKASRNVLAANIELFHRGHRDLYRVVAVELRKLLCDGRNSLVARMFPSARLHPLRYTAWPLAAVAIAVLFRKEIRRLLARIKKGKVGSAELEFENDVQALSDEAPAKAAATPEPSAAASFVAAKDPGALILGSFADVESVLRHFAHANLSPSEYQPAAKSAHALVRALEQQGILSPDTGALYRDLKALRNQAAHSIDFEPSYESVMEFVRLIAELRTKIDTDLAKHASQAK